MPTLTTVWQDLLAHEQCRIGSCSMALKALSQCGPMNSFARCDFQRPLFALGGVRPSAVRRPAGASCASFGHTCGGRAADAPFQERVASEALAQCLPDQHASLNLNGRQAGPCMLARTVTPQLRKRLLCQQRVPSSVTMGCK